MNRKFHGDVNFHFDWWRFKFLADPAIALEAAHQAARADLILLAPNSPSLPQYVQGWFDEWLPHRDDAGGALVLVQPSGFDLTPAMPIQTFMRRSAKRGRLDYLRLRTPRVKGNSIAGFTFTQLEMDELLADDNRPMHWGINE